MGVEGLEGTEGAEEGLRGLRMGETEGLMNQGHYSRADKILSES